VINVRQAFWGTGVGQDLLDQAIGDRGCFLWVARDNPRAIAFYARNRFVPDGAERQDATFDIPIIRMVRPEPTS
jgi:GNAT superfamily N-acetyltransferase